MKTALVFILYLCISTLFAQQKKVLDHDVYDIWNRTIQHAISDNGQWLLYAVRPDNGDGKLTYRNLQDNRLFEIARGDSAHFSKNSQFAAFLIRAKLDSVKKAKKDKKKGAELPQDSLVIIDLANGEVAVKNIIKSYKMPEEADGWLAWQLKFSKETEDSGKAEQDSSKAKEKDKAEKKEDKKKKAVGDTLYVLSWQDKFERFFEHVSEYAFSKNGRYLAMAFASKDSLSDGLAVLNLQNAILDTLIKGAGDYKNLTWDEESEKLAFIANLDSFKTEQQAYALYLWQAASKKPLKIAYEKSVGIPENWWISEHGALNFSKNGERLFFATAPRPEPEPEDVSLDEMPKLDVWHWQDPLLQPMQLKQLDKEQKRSYLAVYNLKSKKIHQLATLQVPEITVSAEGNGRFAIGLSNLPYRQDVSWDFPDYYDVYLLDLEKETSKRAKQKVQYKAGISPQGKYLFWWDRDTLTWKVLNTKNNTEYDLGQAIKHPLYNEQHDWPHKPEPSGFAGWTDDDEQFIFYDTYDLWAVNPKQQGKPENITKAVGRKNALRFRYLDLDKEVKYVDLEKPLLLSAFHEKNKQAGYYKLFAESNAGPEKFILDKKRFSKPVKSKDSEMLYFTREDFNEYPDFWMSNLEFKNPQKVSNINPQQKDYLWGTTEQFEWIALDGQKLQGILCKPENFDPTQKYPMIVYFYERNSDNLYAHQMPEAHRSVINWTFYTSRGYLVFIPDIPYKIGYPGQSAYNAVIPGVTKLIESGFVDKENIGVQGHSWGGYQIAYLVTQTNIFKAAEAGAPVSNMTSAYGGIRWRSGKSRMFQYENTQSRIGGTLWEKPLEYIENSPLFWLEKVQTPLLIMHNDEDGAVPWEQGIELFNGLRRLGKPAWMIVYNDQPHWPITFVNKRDWQTRLQQYFDHFLKGAPAPVWLKEGIPAIKKGKTVGIELTE